MNIGVDIEDIAPRLHLKSLIEAVMTPAERAELAALTGPERLRQFYRFWTGKEALVKALGDGFSTDVSKLELPEVMRRGAKSGVFRFPHRPKRRSGGWPTCAARSLPRPWSGKRCRKPAKPSSRPLNPSLA